jgi:hypothetical protein
MTDIDWMELLFRHTWWTWTDGDRSWHSIAVHTFNLIEGLAWCVFSVLVLRRHICTRKSRTELLYSLAFLTFGATDFIEAYSLTSWLIWIKLMNLVVLWRLRAMSLRKWHPGSRLY